MTTALEVTAAVLLLVGAFVVACAAVGVARFPDPFTRMHAATKAGVVGSGLMLLGAGLALGSLSSAITAVAAVIFLIATTPIASHLLGRAAYVAGAPIAPATVLDALAGTLDRKLFDIDPARIARPVHAHPTRTEDATMHAVPIRDSDLRPKAGQVAVRRVVCWLSGSPRQREASAVALDVARDHGASLVALSMIDCEAAMPRTAVPIGGSHWARWLAGARLKRMREAAATAFVEFHDLARDARVSAEERHEEGDFSALPAHVAAADILVVPAAIDRLGEAARVDTELATFLAQARLIPVLRVSRRPGVVRHVAIVTGTTSRSARLANGLIHAGLWADARITVIPAGDRPDASQDLARGQVDLLRAHGRSVELGDPLSSALAVEAIAARLRRYEAVVIDALSVRGGWFTAIRSDVHEVAADVAPVVLLP